MSDINLIIQNTTPANLTLSTALGEQGPQGPQGQAGANAPVNVVSIGTVSTGAEGSSASASMTGTAPNQTLNLTIPRGNTGATGSTGATGPANALLIGSVTTGSPGDNAVASITGTAPNQILNLTLPRGATGPTGSTGATGPANSLSIGTVSTGAEGSSASATITGTAPSQTLSLTIPRGNTGSTGATGATGPQGAVGPAGPTNSLAIGTVSTAASGVSASATITGTAPNQTLNLTLPRGDTGATGATGSTAGVSTNTPSTVVQRDSSGNFSAGTITASLNGNAATATTATTATTADAIADGAVSTTAKIANGVVTAAKLGITENLRIAKCWVNFNGTGTPAIRSSYNVSSITKNGTGDYTVNFATAMAGANYTTVASFGASANTGMSGGLNCAFAISASSVRVRNMTVGTAPTVQDSDQGNVAVFGN